MNSQIKITVTDELKDRVGHSNRIDVFLQCYLKDKFPISRTIVEKIIPTQVLVNESKIKSSYKVKVGDIISLDLKTVEELFKDIKQGSTQIFEIVPTKGNLDILFENHDLLVINKQAGIAMHPGAGSKKIPTMANYVRFYLEGKGEYDETVENAGVVHRLDRCVAGVTIWAKNSKIQKEMRNLFKAHLITKVYRANIDRINGTKDLLSEIEEGKWHLVEGFIRRDASNRYRRQFTLNKSDNTCKEASMYIIYKNNEIYISLITGRNHQIRAALRFFGYFVKGDTLYSKPFSKLSAIPNEIELYSIFLRINDGQYKNNPWAIGLSEYEQNIIVNLPNKAVVC